MSEAAMNLSMVVVMVIFTVWGFWYLTRAR